jgi:glycosyltransferase involved in cell wall biosynthesis
MSQPLTTKGTRPGRKETKEWSGSQDGSLSTPGPKKSPEADVSELAVPTIPLSHLAVIIPTKNNELSIGTLVLLSKEYAENVIVVDDGSTDRTVDVAIHAGADVINARPYGGGRVQSILAGCKRALGYDCKAVVLLNSGGEHLTREIPRIAQPVLDGKADLVIGSRNLGGRKGIPRYELDVTAKSCELVQGSPEFCNTDPGSTFRAISVKGICLLDLLPDSDAFEPMMVTLYSQKKLTVQEVPITLRNELIFSNDDALVKYKGKKIAVVVPAHNEELLIGDTLSGIPDFAARVYVVNDCSTDRTQEVVDYYASHDDSIIPIYHEVNQGVGASIVTGYRKALEDGMDIIAVMAGDNQMDPAFLPELLDPIVAGKCDYTMGNRLVSPVYRKGMSTWRFFGNSILTLLTKIASGYWQMVDPQNGYTAITKRALERISLDDVYPRYGYCNDLLVKLNVIGFWVINVPHPARYGREKSGIKYSSYIMKLSWLLFRDFLWRLKMKYVVLGFHPLVFFYLFGVFFGLIGIFGMLFTFYDKVVAGHPMFVPLAVSLVMIGIGTQCLFFAMFFDMQQEKNTNGWYA